jgi:probable HAF family extracellular repeat protein
VAGWSYTSFVANPSTGVPTVDPFLWSPETGKMTDLGSLGGTFGAPFFLNNRGQVAGISNLPGDTNAHPFLWSRSKGMKDLGTLGGTGGFPTWVNEAGEVVGTASTANQGSHAFLWRHGVMTDLGTVGTDVDSQAFSINSQGQVVGGSGFFGPGGDLHGFLWEHGGPIADLNALLLPSSGLTVNSAPFINDRGEIAGTGIVSNGDQHAVLLIPCDEHHAEVEGCDFSEVEVADSETAASASQHPATPKSPVNPLSQFTTSRNRRFGDDATNNEVR